MKLRQIAYRIRLLGYLLLVGGCIAMAQCYVDIAARTHTLWVWHSQNLPTGETITRDLAVTALREFQLKANWLFREMVLLPTLAMFLGGLLLGFGKKEN